MSLSGPQAPETVSAELAIATLGDEFISHGQQSELPTDASSRLVRSSDRRPDSTSHLQFRPVDDRTRRTTVIALNGQGT